VSQTRRQLVIDSSGLTIGSLRDDCGSDVVTIIIRWLRGRGYRVNTRLVDATMLVWRSLFTILMLLLAVETYYVQHSIYRVSIDPSGR
jgi:hypothetical protein